MPVARRRSRIEAELLAEGVDPRVELAASGGDRPFVLEQPFEIRRSGLATDRLPGEVDLVVESATTRRQTPLFFLELFQSAPLTVVGHVSHREGSTGRSRLPGYRALCSCTGQPSHSWPNPRIASMIGRSAVPFSVSSYSTRGGDSA